MILKKDPFINVLINIYNILLLLITIFIFFYILFIMKLFSIEYLNQ